MENKLTISCSKQNLAKIRQFVADILDRQAIKEVEAHKLVLAVDEICANLIIHSNHCNPSHTIEVYVDFQPADQVTFVIRDQGISFNLSTYAEPSLDEIVSSRRKGGVGLMLVKRIMDKIEFSTEKNYNICKLTKKLSK
ncbi:ATP-binding protein [Marinoscillum sp.]|uniref:ATP-binding protein n=1 Tax=Marinoscillum sp. TaxID=2024838 RepID=UPI003BA9212C